MTETYLINLKNLNMIKNGILIFCLFLITTACKNEGNKGVIKSNTSETAVTDNNGEVDSITTSDSTTETDGKKTEKTNYVYKATDGTLVKVVFETTPKESTVAITSNKKTFTLQKAEAKGHETIYKKDDMTARVKGDSLFLEQDNNVIELKRTKI